MSFPLNVVVRAGEQAADSFFLLHPLFLPSSSPCIAAKAANEICFANGILHKSKRFLPSRSNHLDRFRNRIIVFVIRIREIFHFTNRILNPREKIESKGANKGRKGKTNRREIDRLALERARIPRPCLLNIPIAACINVYSQIRRVEIESAETGRLSGDGKLSVKRDSSSHFDGSLSSRAGLFVITA